MTVYLPALSRRAREALERAGNRSEYVREALEAFAAEDGTERRLAEIREALGRIEAFLSNGRVAAGVPAPTTEEMDAETLNLLMGAMDKLLR